MTVFNATDEQQRVIDHEGSAFVSACPGAGKTRVMVERARRLIRSGRGKSVAFLSFTNDAVSELSRRLRIEMVLPDKHFPHYLGTFDAFLWQFIIAPFGIPGVDSPPKLVPDKGKYEFKPYEGAKRTLKLEDFDFRTGKLLESSIKRKDLTISGGQLKAFERCAATIRERLRIEGVVDFNDVRAVVQQRLQDADFSKIVGNAMGSRFEELIVDEAQDCNPEDLETIDWLRSSGIRTMVICDPHQAIYGFRGGVTDHLSTFSENFDDRLRLSGNFRSSKAICKAVGTLRRREAMESPDEAIGEHRDSSIPVHVLTYTGSRVPSELGSRFAAVVEKYGLELSDCPLLAATKATAVNAIGQPRTHETKVLSLLLAEGVTAFHFDFEGGYGGSNRKKALEKVHEVVLRIEGRIGDKTYRQYLTSEGIADNDWRPGVLNVVRKLRYDSTVFTTPDEWLRRAQDVLKVYVPPSGTPITKRLQRHSDLGTRLVTPPTTSPSARTIHSAKGLEFPGVCVVTTSRTLASILDYLEGGGLSGTAEEARKLYVGTTRARQLLVIAVPQTQASRLVAHITSLGATVLHCQPRKDAGDLH